MDKFNSIGDLLVYIGVSRNELVTDDCYELLEICKDHVVLKNSIGEPVKVSKTEVRGMFHSSHYKNEKGIEPISYIMSNNMSFNRGNIIKYAHRVGNKKGQEVLDCKKIIDYTMLLAYEIGIDLDESEVMDLIKYRFDWIKKNKKGENHD